MNKVCVYFIRNNTAQNIQIFQKILQKIQRFPGLILVILGLGRSKSNFRQKF